MRCDFDWRCVKAPADVLCFGCRRFVTRRDGVRDDRLAPVNGTLYFLKTPIHCESRADVMLFLPDRRALGVERLDATRARSEST
jgi:hypothetical protein